MQTAIKQHQIKKHIGQKLRFFRKAEKITQRTLSKKIGVTYQQLQKYESGMNNISAEKLFLIGAALRRPITDFFTIEIEL